MRTFILGVISSFIFLSFTNAQSKLSGTVADENGEKIFFATVALHSLTDSTFILANSTDENGYFEITEIKDGNYYLEVSMLGFNNYKINLLNFPENNEKNMKLSLSEDAHVLSTVEVVSKVPLLEQKADRLIVNVENNLTNISGSILDVMKKIPGMLVVGNNLRMAGQSNLTILINGKTTKYMDIKSLMKDIPGDNIKKVEVIHQPGAEFDAEGTGPIINIILKKNSLFGTNGSIRLAGAKGVNWKGLSSLSLSHYKGDINLSGSISYRRSADYDELNVRRIVQEDIYDQVSIDPGFLKGLRANLGLDWDMTKRQRIGFTSQVLDNKVDNTIENNTKINSKSEGELNLITNNNSDERWQLFSINPYYTFEIDTNGQKLNFDLNLVNIKAEGNSTLVIDELGTQNFFEDVQYLQNGDTKIFTSQLDYTYPILKELNVSVGAKYSDAKLDNNLKSLQELNTPGNWQENTSESNHFIFDETILSLYSKLNFNAGKWSGTLGLRFEESNSTGFSVTLDSSLNRKISKLFPSFSISRNIAGPISAALAYSYRIDRPRYSTLNPFVYSLDKFTSQEGNPNLRPGLTHSGKFNLIYEGQPFFNIEYKSSSDAIVEVLKQDDSSGETSLTTVNLKSFKNFNASLFFPLDFIPGIEGFGGFIANRNLYDSDYLNEEFISDIWDYTAFLEVEFELPWEIESEVSFWYNSGGQDGLIKGEQLYGTDLGFSKDFLNDQLNVSFGIENAFTNFFTGNVNFSNMDVNIFNKWDGPEFSLQFQYNFGNRYMKTSRKRRSSGDDEINRAQKR